MKLPKFGADTLLAHHYQNEAIAAHPSGACAGIFLNTAGKAHQTLRAMCRSGKYSEIVVHIAPFDYSHAYPIKSLQNFVLAETAWLNQLQSKFPNTKLMPSPFCEHNHLRPAIEPLLRQMQKAAPLCEIVNTIWNGQSVPGIITEFHLLNSRSLRTPPPGEFIVTFDGFGGDGDGDMPDANISRIILFYLKARQIRGWNFRCNGKFGHGDESDLNNRVHWPSVQYLRGLYASMKIREGEVLYTGSNLYKPFADDHGNVEPTKDNKAMCILEKIYQDSVLVRDSKGSLLDTMHRVLPDNSLGARYYSKKWAFQIARKARKNTGSSLIKIANMPLTDGDLRSGLFK